MAHLPQPPIDTAFATPEVVDIVTRTFKDKTIAPGDRFMDHFTEDMTYVDVAMGWRFDFDELRELMHKFSPTWEPSARSYPTRILGDDTSAVVFFTDTPDLFAGEFRIAAMIDFVDGKIAREVDYSDGRHHGVDSTAKLSSTNPDQFRTPAGSFPDELGEAAVGERAGKGISTASRRLAKRFAGVDVLGAAELFSADATFEDLTLRTTFVGKLAIAAFLQSALSILPYGPGTTVRHIVGDDRAGGYEWKADSGEVRFGAVCLELDERGLITRLTSIWDGSLIDDDAMLMLLKHTIER